jgi:hypothetical protein
MELERGEMLKQSGFAALTFLLGGSEVVMTAREARAADVPYRTLNATEVKALDALGDTLLPGAAAAGMSHYVDQQISIPPAESLVVLRYLDVPPPYARFYQGGLAALDAVARAQSKTAFADAGEADRRTIVRGLGAPADPAGWNLPLPARLFYFALRSDAVDVVYGTVEGFQKLGIPYMPHIAPQRSW